MKNCSPNFDEKIRSWRRGRMKRTNQRSDFSLNNKLLDDWRVVPGDLAISPRCMPVFILLAVYHVYPGTFLLLHRPVRFLAKHIYLTTSVNFICVPDRFLITFVLMYDT